MSRALPSSPAARRNREPIRDVLRRVLPARGLVLEIASGTGEHAVFFAESFPDLVWQPSDASAEAVEWIALAREASGAANLRPPVRLDVCEEPWPVAQADAIYCANMIHIAPWAAALSLVAGAARRLATGGALVTYGPYHVDGRPTSPSNAAFDRELRARDPEWGVRDLESVRDAVAEVGLVLVESVAMPANNLTLVFRRA